MKSPEARVLRQLVEALLFEGLVSYVRIPAANDLMQFRFHLGQLELKCLGRISAFGRVRVQEGSLKRRWPDGRETAIDLLPVLDALPAEEAVRNRLRDELEQTVKFCEWNRQHLKRPPSRRNLGLDALENAIDEGHLYHPSFKARLGFGVKDHEQYGPEASNPFTLGWLAVRRAQVRQSIPAPEQDFWLQELGPHAWDQLSTSLYAQGGNWQDYTLMPIHPWQWQNLQKEKLQPALARREVLYLGTAGDQYCAMQSLRTLQNRTSPARANVKLPLNVVNTSSIRSLTSHSVCTAPAISHWLHQVVEADHFLAQANPVVLKEYAAQLYMPDTPEEAASLDGQLGMIWRESLHPYLKSGESAVPMTALMVTEADGKPFIHDWITEFGVETWTERLIDVVVIPVWHLLLQQGIALEAHAQNMILIHRNGWPERIALRDFHESVEYAEHYLTRPDLKPDFTALNSLYAQAPDDLYYWMSSVEALRELVMDTLFVFNLAELSFLLETHYRLPERQFWHRVHCRLLAHTQDLGIPPERWSALGADAPFIQAESLLTKKLSLQQHREFHHQVPNALYFPTHRSNSP